MLSDFRWLVSGRQLRLTSAVHSDQLRGLFKVIDKHLYKYAGHLGSYTTELNRLWNELNVCRQQPTWSRSQTDAVHALVKFIGEQIETASQRPFLCYRERPRGSTEPGELKWMGVSKLGYQLICTFRDESAAEGLLSTIFPADSVLREAAEFSEWEALAIPAALQASVGRHHIPGHRSPHKHGWYAFTSATVAYGTRKGRGEVQRYNFHLSNDSNGKGWHAEDVEDNRRVVWTRFVPPPVAIATPSRILNPRV